MATSSDYGNSYLLIEARLVQFEADVNSTWLQASEMIHIDEASERAKGREETTTSEVGEGTDSVGGRQSTVISSSSSTSLS